MTVLHKGYEFVVEEGVVYELRRITSVNVVPSLQVTGDGSVDMRVSIQTPTAVDDPILTLDPEDANLAAGFYPFQEATPNYIKFEESASGSRVITLSGFKEPKALEF